MLFANINLAVQVATLLLQTVVTAGLLRWFGLTVTLVLLPIGYFAGFTSLGLSPVLPVLIAVEIAHRSLAYGLAAPAREILFTVVSRAEKFQSKSFIDTVVWRGGDVAAGQLYDGFRGLEFG